MAPARFTDEQLDAVMAAAQPLSPRDRSCFLRDVAAALSGCELGPGIIHRVVAECQNRYRYSNATTIDGRLKMGGKYGR